MEGCGRYRVGGEREGVRGARLDDVRRLDVERGAGEVLRLLLRLEDEERAAHEAAEVGSGAGAAGAGERAGPNKKNCRGRDESREKRARLKKRRTHGSTKTPSAQGRYL